MFTAGEKIKKIRLERGINQSILAERAGISQAYLSEIETGKKTPSPQKLATIARVLGVSPTVISVGNVVVLDEELLSRLYSKKTRRFIMELLTNKEYRDYVVFMENAAEEGITPKELEALKQALLIIRQQK